jgi:hypothetical protein
VRASEVRLRFPLAGGYIGQEHSRSQRAKRHQVDCLAVVWLEGKICTAGDEMMCDRWTSLVLSATTLALCGQTQSLKPAEHSTAPYISVKEPITLLSANEGVSDILWRRTPEGLIDFEMKTPDSFTVIRLWPDRPPTSKTVYGTVPCTIAGTPTMAISGDGRFGLITNHGCQSESWGPLRYPEDQPLTNADIRPEDMSKQKLAPPRSDMVSMIDLASPEFRVVDRVLFDDQPTHVLPHPDGEHFVVGASVCFYVFRIENGKLVEVSRSRHDRGHPCFWITPRGDRIIATHANWATVDRAATVDWYAFTPQAVSHRGEVRIQEGVDTQLTPETGILRVSPDGRKALICQDSSPSSGRLTDILVVDLTQDPPVINAVIKQVAHGTESFAFHPNGKMAVATCLGYIGLNKNSIAILDIASDPPRLLYHMDASGSLQGIEFTPEGDKLLVGSTFAHRIEVFDVVGDYHLRKSDKVLITGHGHCSLTVGPTYAAER